MALYSATLAPGLVRLSNKPLFPKHQETVVSPFLPIYWPATANGRRYNARHVYPFAPAFRVFRR